MARIVYREATSKAVGRRHGDRTNDAALKLGLDLEHGADVAHGRVAVDLKGRVDTGDVVVELHVDNRADDSDDPPRSHTFVELLVRGLFEGGTRLLGFI